MKTTSPKITLTQARKVLSFVYAGLSGGLGSPKPGEMCVEAAVCYALGLPHGDDPKCVHSAVRRFKIALNDSPWSSNAARSKGMRDLAIAQLGTNDAGFNGKVFVQVLVTETIRQMVPIALRALLRFADLSQFHEQIEAAARTCEVTPNLAAAQAARDLAKNASAAASAATTQWTASASASAASAASAAYAYVAATDYVAASAYASAATTYVATTAYASAASAYVATTAATARDSVLSLCARIGIQALRAGKAHGITLLDKINKDAA